MIPLLANDSRAAARCCAIAAMLWLAWFGAPIQAAAHPDPASVVDGMEHVSWELQPRDVIADLDPESVVVWLGVVNQVRVEHNAWGETVLEYYCGNLPLRVRSREGLVGRLHAAPTSDDYFVVTLRSTTLPVEAAERMRAETAHKTHYVLVAGTPVFIGEFGTSPAVFLLTHTAIISESLEVEIGR